MSDDLGLLDFLAADHDNLQADLQGRGTVSPEESLERHLTAERALLYPLIEKHVPDGRHTAERLRELDQTLVEAVMHMRPGDDQSDDSHAEAVRAALDEHIKAQDEQFAVIRERVPERELVDLSAQLAAVVEEAPTRLHPRLPDSGPLRQVTTALAAEADRLRDAGK